MPQSDSLIVPSTKSFELLSLSELVALPKPGFLIEGVLPSNGISVMFGAPASGKSFLALDWALSVATGREWAGVKVTEGDVLYVAAEGAPGFGQRVHAWLRQNSIPDASEVPRIQFVAEPVHLGHKQDETNSLLRVLRERSFTPSLIVIDTLSRCMAGVDENSASHISAMVNNVELLSRELNSSILLVHHTRRRDLEIRGSSALSGAANMMASVEKTSNSSRVLLQCTKMKDSLEFGVMKFAFQTVRTDEVESCILELVERAPSEPNSGALEGGDDELGAMRPAYRRVLSALPDGGANKQEWSELAIGTASEGKVSKATFHNAINFLLLRDYVAVQPSGDGKTKRDYYRRLDEYVREEDPPITDEDFGAGDDAERYGEVVS